MAPYGLGTLHEAMRPWAHALFLPRNGDLNQLADLVAGDTEEKLDVVQYCVKGSSKGLVAYYPADPESKV
jgi:trimethylguanosine synthase